MVERSKEFVRGARSAAGVAGTFNSVTTHGYRLEDCVLAKLNLRAAKPRRNRVKAESAEDGFLRGFALALADVHRRSKDSQAVAHAAASAGVTLTRLKEIGVASFDVRELKRAGVAT